MSTKTWSETLWGQRGRLIYLLIAAVVLLFTQLGSREIWTQEHRWADIVYGMFYRHDFLHPYLNNVDYYDKPLLSYWLIAGFSLLTGQFSTWALRLPSALAGILAIGSIYRIGVALKDKQLGLLSGWLLLTTFYFIFWAKTSSADMLNLGGTLFAVCWYYMKKEQPTLGNYTVFFMILALTSLCKGLVGAVVPLIVIFPDLMMKQEWKKHLRASFFIAMLPALCVYLLPFWMSAHVGNNNYGENGLALVYRENVLRYFQPFDHQGPIYTYLLYLPIYLLPWAIFFIPALFSLKSRWRTLSDGNKSICWAVLLLFLFFTLSGSRRDYYVLPMVPFAILMTADWILANRQRMVWAGRAALGFFVFMFLNFDIVQPWYYAQGGMQHFANTLRNDVTQIHPWSEWNIVMLDPESKARFYLHLPPTAKEYALTGAQRKAQTLESLLQVWPVLTEPQPPRTIFITRKSYEPMLRKILPAYTVVEAHSNFAVRLLKQHNLDAPVAFVAPS